MGISKGWAHQRLSNESKRIIIRDLPNLIRRRKFKNRMFSRPLLLLLFLLHVTTIVAFPSLIISIYIFEFQMPCSKFKPFFDKFDSK